MINKGQLEKIPEDLLFAIFNFSNLSDINSVLRCSHFFYNKLYSISNLVNLIKKEIKKFSGFYFEFLDWSELTSLTHKKELLPFLIISYLINNPRFYPNAIDLVNRLESKFDSLPTFSEIVNIYKAIFLIDKRYSFYQESNYVEAGLLLAQNWSDRNSDVRSCFVLAAYWYQKMRVDMTVSNSEFESIEKEVAETHYKNYLMQGFQQLDLVLFNYLNNHQIDFEKETALISPHTPFVIEFLIQQFSNCNETYKRFFELDSAKIELVCNDPTATNLEQLKTSLMTNQVNSLNL